MASAIKQRNSSMEILRIIAMFLIIFSHYTAHGVGPVYNETFNGIITALLKTGNLGTDIFVVLSGYFLINSKFSVKKVFTLISQVFFYSVSIYAICCLTSIETFSIRNAVISLFPTTFTQYWFFTTYIVMYLLSPYLNKLLNSSSRATHLKMIFITGFIWLIIPTFTSRNLACNEFTTFLVLYAIGAYIRKYPDNIISKKKNDTVIVILCTVFICFFTIGILRLFPTLSERATFFHSKQSIFIVLIAVGLVSCFSKIKPIYSKTLNAVAGATFGIYLIHDNRFLRDFMWKNIFRVPEYTDSNFMIVHIILSSIVIFIVCFAIEFARKKLIEKPVLILYDKVYDKITPKLTAIQSKIFK